MRAMKTRSVCAALIGGVALLFATAPANAAPVSITIELVNPGTLYPTFGPPTSNPLADSATGSVLQNITGSLQNAYRSPFDDPAGNPTAASAVNAYTAVQGGGSATFNIGTLGPSSMVGVTFLWGSPDFFNKVEFFNGATSLGFVTSNDLTNPNANPPQNPATGQSWVIVLAGGPWTRVVFSSTTNAFEFASLTAACGPEQPINGCVPPLATIPLPAALPLFATGLGALGLIGWRRKGRVATAL
jgi:hypothetical protein